MTAIAPIARAQDEDTHYRPASIARHSPRAEDLSVQSPWRDPLFYLSFVAMGLLLCAVGVLLLFRIATRRRA